MNVLFIYPDLNIDVNWQGHYYEGIASLSAILKSKGHHVELAHIYNLKKSEDAIDSVSDNFDLVAFSCTTTMFPYVQYCSRIIKKKFKNKIPLLCGGAHPTGSPKETLIKSEIDYVCMGEGEYFILDFLEYLKGNYKKDDINNLAYKNEEGDVVINELRPPINPLDDIPFPDRELFNFQLQNADLAFFSAGRGCPYQCAYCSNNHLNKIYNNKYLRFKKPETVISDIELHLKKYPSVRQVVFYDDVFILNENWLLDFCKMYSSSIKLPFKVLAHPVAITDSRIKIIKDAGCIEVNFGLQSGNEYIRNEIMLRRVSDNKIKESIKILRKYKMEFLVDVIFGVPFEKKMHMLDTIKFCAENDITAKSHIFYPLPNTKLEQLSIESGLFDKNIYGEDYHSKTILNYSILHKARILFFHRYCKSLILIYKVIGYSLNSHFLKMFSLYVLDKMFFNDINIYFVMMMRSYFINIRSLIRKVFGINEYQLNQLLAKKGATN